MVPVSGKTRLWVSTPTAKVARCLTGDFIDGKGPLLPTECVPARSLSLCTSLSLRTLSCLFYFYFGRNFRAPFTSFEGCVFPRESRC